MTIRKSIIVQLLSLAIAITYAAPPADKSTAVIPIISQSQDGPHPDGSYSWSYETANKITANEQASASNDDENSPVVQGAYSYVDNEGTLFRTTYVAGKDGFRPQGPHIPVAPELPPGIVRGLEWIVKHPEQDGLRK